MTGMDPKPIALQWKTSHTKLIYFLSSQIQSHEKNLKKVDQTIENNA